MEKESTKNISPKIPMMARKRAAGKDIKGFILLLVLPLPSALGEMKDVTGSPGNLKNVFTLAGCIGLFIECRS